jgi:hypothetical protein
MNEIYAEGEGSKYFPIGNTLTLKEVLEFDPEKTLEELRQIEASLKQATE